MKPSSLFKKSIFAFFICSLLLMSAGNSLAGGVNKEGKNWKLRLNTFFGYDDNVTQSPDNAALRPASLTGKDDQFFTWSGGGSYLYKHNNKMQLKAEYDIDMTIYDDLGQYDLTTQIFGLNPIYKVSGLSQFNFQYMYIYNIVDGNNFSGINLFRPSYYHMSQDFGLSRINFIFKDINNWANAGRDGRQIGIGADQVFFFNEYKNQVGVGIQFTDDDTTNKLFDRTLLDFKLNGRMDLCWGVTLDGFVKLSFRDYTNRIADNGLNREDLAQTYRIVFSKDLLKQWHFLHKLTAKLKFQHSINETNLNLREFDSNRVDVGFQARF